MNEQTTPDYIKENADGTITITLSKPFEVNGEQHAAVTMREPLVKDQLAVSSRNGIKNGANFELALFAQLCDFAPEDFQNMTMKNYGRLQKGYGFFTE